MEIIWIKVLKQTKLTVVMNGDGRYDLLGPNEHSEYIWSERKGHAANIL